MASKYLRGDVIIAFLTGFFLFAGISYSGILDSANTSLSKTTGFKGYAIVMLGAILLMGLVELLSLSAGSRVSFCIGAAIGGAIMFNMAAILIGFGGFTLTFMIELMRWQERRVAEMYAKRKKH